MKDQFQSSAFHPNGQHISELRAQRVLFQSHDKVSLQERKRPAIDAIDLVDSPPSKIDKKANNRLSNNGLDAAYFAGTQPDFESPFTSPRVNVTSTVSTTSAAMPSTKKKQKWLQSIRMEVMRRMRPNNHAVSAGDARKLYKLLSRCHPKDDYTDILTIANDADEMGMTVDETVAIMLQFFEP